MAGGGPAPLLVPQNPPETVPEDKEKAKDQPEPPKTQTTKAVNVFSWDTAPEKEQEKREKEDIDRLEKELATAREQARLTKARAQNTVVKAARIQDIETTAKEHVTRKREAGA